MEIDELVRWCERQRADALRQIDLFGSQGVKAVLHMPDGTTTDITAGVIAHQVENSATLAQVAAALAGRVVRP